MKKRNVSFIFKMVVFVLVMFVAFGGVFTGILLLIARGFAWEYLAIVIIALPVGYLATLHVIKLNGTWTSTRISEIREGKVEHIVLWEHPQEFWQKYLSWRKGFDSAEAKGLAMVSILIAIVIFLFSFYAEFDGIEYVLYSLGGGIGLGLIVGLLFHMGYNMRRKKLSASPVGKITFTQDAILINNLLIYFSEMGVSFGSMKVVREDDFDLLRTVTRTRSKNGHNEHTYWIPIPEDKMEEADKLVLLYNRAASL